VEAVGAQQSIDAGWEWEGIVAIDDCAFRGVGPAPHRDDPAAERAGERCDRAPERAVADDPDRQVA
jgi:hypothetical protein